MSAKAGSAIDQLPPHVRETVDAIGALHAQHREGTTSWERWFELSAGAVSRPIFIVGLTILVVIWMLLNVALAFRAPDPAPFALLDTLLTLLAVYISLAILAAQRRATVLADLRAQLTLQHAILAENKVAKVIQLLEELRKDDPMIEDRPDSIADAMANPTNPNIMAAAISENNDAQIKAD